MSFLAPMPWYILGLITYHFAGKYRFEYKCNIRQSGTKVNELITKRHL